MHQLDRRKFLRLCTIGASCITSTSLLAASHSPKYLSAYSTRLKHYGVAIISHKGEILHTHDLPSRGHAFAINPVSKQIYCISRRPANTIDVLHSSGTLLTRIKSKESRHFYGHAACSHDGRYLYTSENNLHDGTGVIGVRDTVNDFLLVNEFSSYGIGPHSIQRSPDNQYLIIANGGIHTHPRTGRKPLNGHSMSPSLVFIDIHTGKLHRKSTLPAEYRLNSIRHIAVNNHNHVFIALQNQGELSAQEILLAEYNYTNNKLSEITIPPHIQPLLKGYLGDIVLDQSQHILATTSPRGDLILFYDIVQKKLWHESFVDTCGLQASHRAHEFIISNGQGDIRYYHANTHKYHVRSLPSHPMIHWDNHIVAL